MTPLGISLAWWSKKNYFGLVSLDIGKKEMNVNTLGAIYAAGQFKIDSSLQTIKLGLARTNVVSPAPPNISVQSIPSSVISKRWW